MTFVTDKKQVLSRKDRSKKQSIDARIKALCSILNEHDDYYTTSSCSGRTVLVERTPQGGKNIRWLLVSHATPTHASVLKALKKPFKADLWLRYESAILHVVCKTIEHAKTLLHVMHTAGFKRAGITNLNKRIVIEMMGTEFLDCLLAKNGKLVVDEHYIKHVVDEAKQKHKTNINRLRKLTTAVRRL